MSKRGVSKISGNASPKVGEAVTYTVTDWYPSTPQNQRNLSRVTWELFKKRSNGRFTTTNIKKVGDSNFTFGEVAQKHTYRLEAYLFEPEGSGASTIEITPQPAVVPKIEKVELQYVDDTPGTVFSFTEKMRARAQCVNLNGKKLKFTLWEDDEAGEGHNAKNLLIETKEATVDQTGVAVAEFMLTRALMQKAMRGEADAKQLEFYVTVEYFSHNKHATENYNIDNPLFTTPVPAVRPQPRPQQPTNNSPVQTTPQTQETNIPPRAENSPAAEKPHSQMEEREVVNETATQSEELHDYQETQGTIEADQPPTQQSNEGKTVSVVQDSSVEELVDAYFAKKVYRDPKEDEEKTVDSEKYSYTFNNEKGTAITAENKSNLASIIHTNIKDGKLGNPKVDDKKIVYVADVEAALSIKTYAKGEKIDITQYKRIEELQKINSAPLDSKLYLVAKTASASLNGKQANIIIKEKDGVLKGSPDAVLPILEITEEQMSQAAPTSGEVPGTEKPEFTGTIKNGIVKIPVHLRPKSNEELSEWQKKIEKGKEDGKHTYTPKNSFTVDNEEEHNKIAETIVEKVNKELGEEYRIYLEDVKSLLVPDGQTRYTEVKDIPKYKKQPELLYLNVKAQGEKQHDKDFLKAENQYFVVGKSKVIIFPFLVKPENDIAALHKNYYWAAAQGNNQAAFNSNRGGGTRKHAGRDLYSKPYTEVVAICGGKVLDITTNFADGTGAVTVLHETTDGRKFIIRYGEVENDSVEVKKDQHVRQGELIGKTGFLRTLYKRVVSGYEIYMLHFEYFSGDDGFDITSPLSNTSSPFRRRSDLKDGLAILQEGYKNTFDEDTGDGELFTVEDGKEAITELYNRYKDQTWNWKWEGSEEEVTVTGKDLVTIVEKMYRLETAHFASKQYQHCGTGGMEVFGAAPYYGWDSTLFIEEPTGTWSAFEGKGLSGAGGNEQVKNKQKEFVKLPSVLAGMEYKAKYIIKYNGKYERWFNANDTTAQTAYRSSLVNIRARFVEAL